jgi:hypothetical protein
VNKNLVRRALETLKNGRKAPEQRQEAKVAPPSSKPPARKIQTENKLSKPNFSVIAEY